VETKHFIPFLDTFVSNDMWSE